jgi:putative hydrolase of the HAD superfamily
VTAAATAVVFDLGGVITESPMTAFTAYEAEAGLPEGLIVRLNSTDPDTNAWARFERNELDAAGFTDAFEAEALAAGHRVDARRVLAALAGELRPLMVEAVRRLRAAGVPLALLSNNVAPMERTGRLGELLELFDAVVESSVEGVRKPEPEIYRRALARLSEAVGSDLAPSDCAYPAPGPGPSPGSRALLPWGSSARLSGDQVGGRLSRGGAVSTDVDAAMGRALELAAAAVEWGDTPIGAVVLGPDGTVLAEAANERERRGDPTAHAEVLALRAAARVHGDGWRLTGTTLVVTLEPCTMCAGASVLARVDRVVYGADDPKAGAAGSLWDVVRDRRLNHRPQVTGGVRAEESAALLRAFFRRQRGL